MWFRFPSSLSGQIASKGSIAVDGVSLTLVDVEEERFRGVNPHTLAVRRWAAAALATA
jgi:riboflavin synthase